jgi:hypothetical protein
MIAAIGESAFATALEAGRALPPQEPARLAQTV